MTLARVCSLRVRLASHVTPALVSRLAAVSSSVPSTKYCVPLGAANDAEMTAVFARLTSGLNPSGDAFGSVQMHCEASMLPFVAVVELAGHGRHPLGPVAYLPAVANGQRRMQQKERSHTATRECHPLCILSRSPLCQSITYCLFCIATSGIACSVVEACAPFSQKLDELLEDDDDECEDDDDDDDDEDDEDDTGCGNVKSKISRHPTTQDDSTIRILDSNTTNFTITSIIKNILHNIINMHSQRML